jgi:cobalt/nickel transport system permease protein
MIDGEFAIGNSVMHRFDPRARLLFAMLFSAVVAVSDRFPALALSILVGGCLIGLAGLSPKRVFSRLLVANGFIFCLWALVPFTISGETVFSLGPFAVTREGVFLAAWITLKCNAILMALMALVATMSVFTTARALRHLHVPEKLVYLIFFTYRYIHVIFEEYQRLMCAAKTRGFRPRTGMHCYRTYAYLVGMTFVKSHERAERVLAAMRCRGFTGKFYDLSEFSFRPMDGALLAAMVLAVACMVILQRIG